MSLRDEVLDLLDGLPRNNARLLQLRRLITYTISDADLAHIKAEIVEYRKANPPTYAEKRRHSGIG